MGFLLEIVLLILSGAPKYKTGYCSLWVLLKNIFDTRHTLADPLYYMTKQQGYFAYDDFKKKVIIMLFSLCKRKAMTVQIPQYMVRE